MTRSLLLAVLLLSGCHASGLTRATDGDRECWTFGATGYTSCGPVVPAPSVCSTPSMEGFVTCISDRPAVEER